MTNIPEGILGDMGVALTRFRVGAMGLIFREKPTQDFGIDGEIEVFEDDHANGQIIAVQVKCGSSYLAERDGEAYVFRFGQTHYDYWTRHAVPVIIVLVDPSNEQCFWAEVQKSGVVSTGQNYKLLVPFSQQLAPDGREKLTSVASPLVSANEYELLSEEDQSTGPLRRLSYYVKLNATGRAWSRGRIEQVIRQVTAEARTSEYFRSVETASAHASSPPRVVWVYAYFSESQREIGAYIARSIWLADDVPQTLRPNWVQGEAKPGFNIDWNQDFDTLVTHISGARVSKAQYLSFVAGPMIGLNRLLAWCEIHIHNKTHQQNERLIAEADEVAKGFLDRPVPPIECQRLDDFLERSTALLANAKLFADRGLLQEGGVQFKHQAEVDRYLLDAKQELWRAEDELKQVNR